MKVGGAYRVLDPRIEREVLRVAQEALANVLQHAQATETHVQMQYLSDALVLSVRDNGHGFSVDAASREGHYGLTGYGTSASIDAHWML